MNPIWKELLSADLQFMVNNEEHEVPLNPEVAYANAVTTSKPPLLPAPLAVLRYNELWVVASIFILYYIFIYIFHFHRT